MNAFFARIEPTASAMYYSIVRVVCLAALLANGLMRLFWKDLLLGLPKVAVIFLRTFVISTIPVDVFTAALRTSANDGFDDHVALL